MKKSLLGLCALTLMFVGTQSIFAEDPQPTYEDQSSKTSVSFVENTDPTTPINPENPDQPGEPTDPGTGMEGPLSIDYIPTLPFGEQTITGRVETYKSTNLKPYLQVTDTRGTGAGWQVTVTMGALTGKTSGSTIPDAKLTFSDPVVKKPTSNNGTAPTAASPLSIVAGKPGKPIFTAAAGQGTGTWLETWMTTSTTENEKIKLEVNTNYARNEAYEATLNWSINLAP